MHGARHGRPVSRRLPLWGSHLLTIRKLVTDGARLPAADLPITLSSFLIQFLGHSAVSAQSRPGKELAGLTKRVEGNPDASMGSESPEHPRRSRRGRGALERVGLSPVTAGLRKDCEFSAPHPSWHPSFQHSTHARPRVTRNQRLLPSPE